FVQRLSSSAIIRKHVGHDPLRSYLLRLAVWRRWPADHGRRFGVILQYRRLRITIPVKLLAIFEGWCIEGKRGVEDLFVTLGFHHVLQELHGQFLLLGELPDAIVKRNRCAMLATWSMRGQRMIGHLKNIGHLFLSDVVDTDGVVHP